MIRLRIVHSPFEAERAEVLELQPDGRTFAQLVEDHRAPAWGRMPVAVMCNGRKLEEREATEPVPDGALVVIGPSTEGLDPLTWVLYAVVSIVLSAAVSWAYSRLVGVPDPDEPERGEDASPTYAWDQVATEYRGGFSVPLIFGEHAVGGTVIYTDVRTLAATTTLAARERLAVVLALGEGRIESIGGVTGGERGEFDGMGGFPGDPVQDAGPAIPVGIKVNGTELDPQTIQPGARAFVRMGEDDQTAFPQGAFPGVSQTDVVNLDLDDAGRVAIFTVEDSDPKSQLELLLAFPGGLYRQDTSGNFGTINAGLQGSSSGQQGCAFFVDWRPANRGIAWVTIGTVVVDVPPTLAAFVHTISIDLVPNNQPPTAAPIEVRVRRLTPARTQDNESSRAIWRQVIWRTEQSFSYPGCALLGLEIQAGDQITGGRPNFLIPTRGLRVRVWDATIGSGAPSAADYWDVPGGGDAYAGIWTYPPGRNPAWVLAAFLTHPKGLGRFFPPSAIDWPAFRNWADFCDRSIDLGAGVEAAFCCDTVLDTPEPAWRVVLRLLQCGRAAPVLDGGKFSVRYQYAAAHGRGTNVVPEKARDHLVSTSQVEAFSVRYFNTNARPSSIVFDILDRADDYAHRTVLVPDPDSGLDDPSAFHSTRESREARKLYGVTRRSQAIREGLFLHAANRLIASEVTFTAGPETITAGIGDIVGVQHDVFRPFGERGYSARITAETPDPDSDEITLDRDVTITSGMAIATRLQDGTIADVAIVSSAGEYTVGDVLELASAIAFQKGAPIVIGKVDKLVRDYEIVATSIALDMKREFRAVEWHPEIHDDIDVDEYLDASSLASSLGGDFDRQAGTADAQPDAASIVVRSIGPGGRRRIAWEAPPGYSGSPARVFVRPAGGSRWWLAGETASGFVDGELPGGQSVEIAVAVANRLGAFPPADAAPRATVAIDEFAPLPPPNVAGARAVISNGWDVALTWEPLGAVGVEVEIRRGPTFLGAELVGRTAAARIEIPAVVPYDDGDQVRFWIAARSAAGLLSPAPVAVDVATTAPSTRVELARTAFDPGDGTVSNLDVTGSGDFTLTLQAGAWDGVWTTEVVSLGFDVAALLALPFEFEWSEDLALDDAAAVLIESGEGHAWRLDGRESTPLRPGLVESFRIDDADGYALGQALPQAIESAVGARAVVAVWYRSARAAETIASMDWVRYVAPVVVVGSQLQVKVEVLRHDLRAEPVVRFLSARRFSA